MGYPLGDPSGQLGGIRPDSQFVLECSGQVPVTEHCRVAIALPPQMGVDQALTADSHKGSASTAAEPARTA